MNSILNTIKASAHLRNKLAFCRERIDGLNFIDAGRTLAELLGPDPDKKAGKSTIYKKLFEKCNYSEEIGPYIALDNIGILFEPELHLNLRLIFENQSVNNWLIIRTDAEISDRHLYFLSKSDGMKVSLPGLPVIIEIPTDHEI